MTPTTLDPTTVANLHAAGTAIGVMFLFWMFALAVCGALWWWAFISTVRHPSSQWEAAGQSKVLWIVLEIGLGVLGAIGYLVAVRSKVKAAVV